MVRSAIMIDERIDREEAVVLAMKKKIDGIKVKYNAKVEKMTKLVEKKEYIQIGKL